MYDHLRFYFVDSARSLHVIHGVYVLLLYNQIHTDTHTECTAILWDAKSSTCKTFKKSVLALSFTLSLWRSHSVFEIF